jgi:hypothetical protein
MDFGCPGPTPTHKGIDALAVPRRKLEKTKSAKSAQPKRGAEQPKIPAHFDFAEKNSWAGNEIEAQSLYQAGIFTEKTGNGGSLITRRFFFAVGKATSSQGRQAHWRRRWPQRQPIQLMQAPSHLSDDGGNKVSR